MKKRILSTVLSLCMVLSLLPARVLAQELTHLSHAGWQDAVPQSVAVQSIGPNEVEVVNDLYEKMTAQVSVITLINDIELNGALRIDYAVTIDLNGHVLKMANDASGSVIMVGDKGHLTIIDSDPTAEHKFTPNADGLWVLDETNGTKTVKGGVIYGGTGTEMYYSTYGGGVLIEDGCQLTMNGGSIVGCKADGAGGGVVVKCGDANGIFTMNGGAIIGCVADSGGGVETDGGGVGEYGQFIMNGGVIDSCVATGRTGGGGVRSDGLFIMGKDATIKNCKAVENGQLNFGSGIVLAGDDLQTINGTIISEDAVDGKYIFVSNGTVTIGENANIHANITLEGGKIDLDGSSATVYGKITNDNYGGASCFVDGLVSVTYKVNGGDYATQILRSGGTASRPIDPTVPGSYEFDGWFRTDGTRWDYSNDTVTENVTLTGYRYLHVIDENTLTDALRGSAEVIRLTEDIDISASLTILRKVTLDLNGHVLKMAGDGSVIKIETTGNLTLIDSNSTAEHKFKVNGVEPWELDDSGTETVNGGVIYGGKGLTDRNSNGYGGGVYIYDGGQFTMIGGNIVGCKAEGYIAYGGGVFVAKGGTFTMTGGSITGCTAVANEYGVAYGGGVRNDGEWRGDIGLTTLSGTAMIRDCHAKGCEYNLYGGGVSDAGTLTISGDVKIIGCTAGGYGSDAMYVNAKNSSSVTGGTFYGSIKDPGNKIHGLTVTYHLNSNENYATQVLQSGGTTGIPDPAKSGYTFDGWYKTDGTKWDTATPVTENLTLTGWLYKGVGTANEFTAAIDDTTIDVIRLEKDITLPSGNTGIKITEGRKVILDLNGYVLDLAGKHISVLRTANVYRQNQLTIMDSRPTAEHKFKDDGTGLWTLNADGDKLVKGGVITGGKDTYGGGAIEVGMYGKLIMNGGNIVGCAAGYFGGAVNIINGAMFEMNGGSIVGCKAGYAGGAVCVGIESNPLGTFTMNGGSITDCTAVNGSGVYLYDKMNAGGGTVDGTVVLADKSSNSGNIQGGGSTFSGLIINNNPQAKFSGVHSPLGIVGEKPIGANGHTYRTVTFDPAGGTMEHTTRYFLRGKNISGEIKAESRTGYFFAGWCKADGTAWDCASDQVAEDITLYAKWTPHTYTVTFDNTGGSEVTPKTMDVTYGEQLGDMPVPIRAGYFFCGWYDAPVGGKCYAGSDGKSTSQYDKTENCTLYAQWKDSEKPTGEIKIGENKWNSFLNKITFGLFFKDTQTVAINASDNGSGIKTVEYLLSAKEYTKAELDGMTFTAYTAPFSIDPDNEYIIYVKLTDNAYNVSYICSDGIVLDAKNPVIKGIENGKIYCEAQTVTIDEKYIDTVTVNVNETAVTLDENNSFILSAADGEQIIVVADKAGNKAEMTVTVNNGHTFGEWASNGDGTHTHRCKISGCNGFETKECSGGTATCTEKARCEACGESYGEKNPANHNGGKQEWTTKNAANHEKKWSCCGALIVASEAHEWANGVCRECGYVCLHTDNDTNHICDICEKIYSNHEDADKNHICDFCGKIISNHEDTDKNHICDFCDKIISNHEDTDKNHICDFCGKTISNHDDTDKNHICNYCGKVITNHTGGKAICKDKAVCEYCGKSYGELDANNHADLKHVPAKAATKEAEGNIEYWYCKDCDKYYSDAEATKGIVKGSILIMKLSDEPKSPKTGDNSSRILWAALLFISGGVCTALTVKKKKQSKK